MLALGQDRKLDNQGKMVKIKGSMSIEPHG